MLLKSVTLLTLLTIFPWWCQADFWERKRIAEECQDIVNGTTGNLRYADLIALIEKHNVNSLDQLLPLLPPKLLRRHGLFGFTRSAQPATPKRPRVTLISPDGLSAFAFSTLAPDNLEVIEYDPARGRNVAKLIFFGPSGDKQPQFIDRAELFYPKGHPKNCAGCHSEDLHFNWDPYNLWAGMMGQFAHGYEKQSKEAAALAAMRAEIDQTSLLRHLPPNETLADLRNVTLEISQSLSETNVKRVAYTIKYHPRYAEYYDALMAALDTSRRRSFLAALPERDRALYASIEERALADIQATMTKRYAEVIARLAFDPVLSSDELEYTVKRQMMIRGKNWAELEFVINRMGMKLDNWFMSIEQRSFLETSPYTGMIDALKQEISARNL